MNINVAENLIIALLGNCGSMDLEILNNSECDMQDVVEYLRDELGYDKIGFNDLTFGMFELGKREMKEFIDNRKGELREVIENEESTDEMVEELEALDGLDPYEDIESFHNCLDTSVWISDEDIKGIYRKYLQEAIDEFENYIGFSLD